MALGVTSAGEAMRMHAGARRFSAPAFGAAEMTSEALAQSLLDAADEGAENATRRTETSISL